jgi:hypothetical protein
MRPYLSARVWSDALGESVRIVIGCFPEHQLLGDIRCHNQGWDSFPCVTSKRDGFTVIEASGL